MTTEKDEVLTALFSQNQEHLVSEEFTAGVIKKTTILRVKIFLALLFLVASFCVLAWAFSFPVQAIVLGITNVLSMPLVDISATEIEWALLPINNIATVLFIVFKIIKITMNKSRSSSWIY